MDFLCTGSELPEGGSRSFTVGRLAVLGVRWQGQVYLYRNRCPHRGIALDLTAEHGVFDPSGRLIECAHHGALFLPDSGECVSGPCEGDALQALGCREDNHGIWLTAPVAPAGGGR